MIIATGSYNGQDSLGDECLLKAVVEQVRHAAPGARIHVLLHGTSTPFIRKFAHDSGVTVGSGFQTFYWRWRSLFLRARIPRPLADIVAAPLFPTAMLVAAALNVAGARTLFGTFLSSKAMFIFGGTQFSGQWFWLNAPYYFLSGFLLRMCRGKVFLGPQQFGPLTKLQSKVLHWFMKLCVSDWRTRNAKDIHLLDTAPAVQTEREVFDEVFSNVRLYPTLQPAQQARYILVNLRASTFDTDDAIDKAQFDGIGELVSTLGARYALPIIFFAVSDASFCDDGAVLAHLRAAGFRSETLTTAGRVRDEFNFFELAQAAKVVVSMSFHGCILAAVAGVPFVPVTQGAYYGYKYAGFDKYAGGQSVPIIELGKCVPHRDAERIAEYLERFDPSRVGATRVEAARMIDEFYADALSE